MRTTRTVATVLVGPVVALVLIGCGPPPWQQPVPGATVTASPTASPRVVPTVKPSPTSPAEPTEPVRNDLAKGSLERTLTAGNTELTIKYWSTLDLGRWTPGASKPLSMSASAEFTDDSEQDIYLSEVNVAVDAVDAAGQAQAVDPLTDEADVTPGYLITAPTSYGQVFTLPAVPARSRSLTLTIRYELLVQTAPEVKRYSRQAAVDIVQIALAS